jgi:hypothetical protein
VLAVLVATSLTLWSTPSATAAPDRTGAQELSRRLGLQSVPKTSTLLRKGGPAAANPMLALLPDPSAANLHAWKARVRAQSKARTVKVDRRKTLAGTAVTPLVVTEREAATTLGLNDRPADAQRVRRFGSSAGKRSAIRVHGNLAEGSAAVDFAPGAEDNGSIPLATDTGVTDGGRTRTTGTIGDGPHGSGPDATGDFDFYAVRGASGGQQLVVDVDTPGGGLDSVAILWDAAGQALAANDDDGSSLDSLLSATLPSAGDYFVSVVGFPTLPANPFDSGSGTEAGSVGAYTVTFGLDALDRDYYAVNLRAGDVLTGSAVGASTRLAVANPETVEVFGSSQDASALYPIVSPLTGGGAAVVDHVATTTGRYYVATLGGTGGYDITLEVYRPGPQAKKATQTIFLDFDGQRVNTAVFGGPGVRQLSPLSAFLPRWGFQPADEDALLDRVIATVKENLKRDLARTGVKVKILNSRDHADPFGRRNVSRLIVGGTIAESGVDTIGIAQSIDPGNFDTAETALILLDSISEPADETVAYSFNTYLKPGSDRIRFIGTALGNITSHEAGHYLGNWHVDQYGPVANLMDQGGNFPLLYGVGPDGIGGTADDPDIDFGPDILNPNEGFTGIENTRTRSQWGLTRSSPRR